MQGLWDDFKNWVGVGPKAPSEETIDAIRRYPVEAERVRVLVESGRAMRAAAEGAPTAVKDKAIAAQNAARRAYLSLEKFRAEVKKAILEARKSGKLSASDIRVISDSGLGAIPLALPASVAMRSALVPAVSISFDSMSDASADGAVDGDGKGVRGLGAIPLIAWGIASVLAAAVVGAGLVAAYRTTSEDAARAEAIRDQAAAALEDWRRRSGTSAAPLALPSIPGQRSTVLENVGSAAGSVVVLVGLGLAAWFIFKKAKKHNGQA